MGGDVYVLLNCSKLYLIIYSHYKQNANQVMEKLTETINAIKVSKSTKNSIIKIAEIEELQIQQVCRRLLTRAINDYHSTGVISNIIKS